MKPNPQFRDVRIVKEAVRRSINPAMPNHFSGAGTGSFVGIEGSFTRPITDGDDILDGHTALWDEDDWDGLDVFWG